jgi:hypothetical protein
MVQEVEALRDICAMLGRNKQKDDTERRLAVLAVENHGIQSEEHVAALLDRAETLILMKHVDLSNQLIR